jgi:hypothetical protein
MVTPKQLSLLAVSVAAGGFFLAQPASASTAVAQPFSFSIGQGSVNTVQPIGHRQWYGYHGGWRGYRRGWGYYRPYRPWRGYGYGYYRPYYGYPAYAYNYGYPYGYGYPYYPYSYVPAVSFGFGYPFWGGFGFDDDGLK